MIDLSIFPAFLSIDTRNNVPVGLFFLPEISLQKVENYVESFDVENEARLPIYAEFLPHIFGK